MTIDDSALFHASSNYDPVKAREYYLRTRQLKGRKRGTGLSGPVRDSSPAKTTVTNVRGGGNEEAARKARREKMLQEKAALEKRLEKLKNSLELLVNAAKARSGVKPTSKSSDKDSKSTKSTKADRKDKPETASQKKERAKKAKEAYEKENPGSLSQDLDILREQIADMQEKIRDAVADATARAQKAEPKPKTGGNRLDVGSVKNNSSGPRGR